MIEQRTPPYSLRAEISVLGAMLLDGDAAIDAAEILTASDFHRESNRRIFRSLIALWEQNTPPDIVTLSERLKNTGELETVGGIDYLAELVDAVPHAANAAYHAQIVRDKSRLRRLIETSSIAIRDAYELGERSVDDVIAAAEEAILSVDAQTHGGYRGMKELLWAALESLEERAKSGSEITGIPTGLIDFDRMTTGLQPGEVTVIAARPSMGKTALALNAGVYAALKHSTPTLVFSFEMTSEKLVERALCSEARVDMQRLRRGRMSPEETARLTTAAGHLNGAKLYIDDGDNAHIGSVMARARRAQKNEGIRLIIIDYAQLMAADGDVRREQVDAISRGVKSMARALDAHVLLLSQLNRKPEERSDKRPMLSDLRESGGIEQDADIVVLLYRPEYYATGDRLAELEGKAELIVAKQRNGPTGSVPVFFEKSYTRFESVAHRDQIEM